MSRQLVARAADGLWHPITWPIPCTQLLLFSPSLAVLSGTAFPHGLPNGVTRIFPLSVADQQQAEGWQTSRHQSLEQQIGSKVDGYVSLRVSRPLGRAPLLVRELPETVGSKVWRGAWLLWKCLANLHGLGGVSRVLELGAGVGLVGLLLAADHSLEVVVSETRSGYGGADLTWENLVYNVQMNAEQIDEGGGRIEAWELDWTQGLQDQVRKFDLVVGSDILYEPHLFEDLLDVMQTAASEAVLVQNVARKGTQYFKELCRARNIGLRAVDVSDLDANEQWLVEGVADAVDGVYQCWFLDFSQARSGSEGDAAAASDKRPLQAAHVKLAAQFWEEVFFDSGP
ncbi:rrg1 [Symbiodinium microadriaticum]|nr:rrg1 [Symbiodinium microadriaticum]